MLKNEGYLLEVFMMRYFIRNLSIYVTLIRQNYFYNLALLIWHLNRANISYQQKLGPLSSNINCVRTKFAKVTFCKISKELNWEEKKITFRSLIGYCKISSHLFCLICFFWQNLFATFIFSMGCCKSKLNSAWHIL